MEEKLVQANLKMSNRKSLEIPELLHWLNSRKKLITLIDSLEPHLKEQQLSHSSIFQQVNKTQW